MREARTIIIMVFSAECHTMNTTSTTNSLSRSILLLNLVALLWGTQQAVIKGVVTMDTPAVAATDWAMVPAVFTLVRFGIAAGKASPYTPALRFAPSPSVASVTAAATTSSNTGTIWRWGLNRV
jgi:hypothetical protein